MAFPEDYTWKFKVAINASQVDATLSNFPVMILLEDVPHSMMDGGSQSCLDGGGDIRAGNESGAIQYPLEVVRCVTNAMPASRALELHIKIPTVDAATDTDIWIYYGNAGDSQPPASDTYGSENVWDSDFVVVSHNGGQNNSVDSSLGTQVGTMATGSGRYAGQVAADFGGHSDNNSWQYGVSSPTQMTMEAVVYFENSVETNDHFISAIHNPAATEAIAMYTWPNDGDPAEWTLNNLAIPEYLNAFGPLANTWFAYSSAQDNGTEKEIYQDGASVGSDNTIVNMPGGLSLFSVGLAGDSVNNLNGLIGEVRYSSVRRSNEWITATQRMLNDHANFLGAASTPQQVKANLSTWGRKQKITIQSSQVSGSTDHTDFPVLITLDHLNAEIVDGGINSALDGGGDVRFSLDEFGETQLACDIVSFVTSATPSSRRCAIWVKVPTLSASSDTDIWIWYNKDGESQVSVGDTYGRNIVWDDEEIVIDFRDTSGYVDRTGNHSLTAFGSMVSPTETGQVFDGVNDYLTIPHTSDLNLKDGFSIRSWHPVINTHGYSYVISKPANAGHNYPYALWCSHLSNSGSFIPFVTIGDNYTAQPNGPDVTPSTNKHLGYTYDRANGKAYIDGDLSDTSGVVTSQLDDNTQDVDIGNSGGSGEFFDGEMTTLFVSKNGIYRSGDWQKTEDNQLRNPQTFALAGAPESVSDDLSTWGRKQKITIQASQVDGSGNHADFPMLITLDHLNVEIVDGGDNSALNGGGDIRFSSDADGNNQLACEIVEFVTNANAANRKCIIWVKVPSLSTSSNTDIYVWYKKAGESQPDSDTDYGSQSVWDNNYVVVAHDCVTNSVDNSSLSLNGSVTGGIADPIGGNQAVDFGLHNQSNFYDMLITPIDEWTIQQWGYSANSITDHNGYSVVMRNDAITAVCGLGQRDDGRWNFWSEAESWSDADPGSATVNTWAKQDLKISGAGGTLKNIRGGVLRNTESNFNDDADKNRFSIGAIDVQAGAFNEAWEGYLCEIRLSNIERSDDWCFAEWNNQNDPANFAVASAPEDVTTSNVETSDFKIQQITDDIGNSGGTNTSFTAVSNLNNAIELANNNRKSHAGSISSTSNKEGDDMAGARVLTATDTLTYIRESGSVAENMRFQTSIWEYVGDPGGENEFIVRGRFASTLNGTTNSITESVTGVSNANDCIPFITGIMNNAGTDDFDSSTAVAYLENASTMRVQKGSNGNNVTVYVTLVEFTGPNWTVLHGDSGNVGADTGTITLYDGSDGSGTATNVDNWSASVIFGHHRADTNASGTNDAIADTWPLYTPGSDTQSVDWSFNSNHDSAGSNRQFVHVLSHSDLTVTRFQNSSNTQGESTIDIGSAGLTDLEQALIVGFSISSGTGTALGRGSRNYYFNSISEAAHWAHRSGNTMSHEIQVVDLSALVTSATQDILLVLNGSDHLQGADILLLTQNYLLGTQHSTHNHTADSFLLSQFADLQAQDSLHSHSATNLLLTQESSLVTQDGVHDHYVDEVILVQNHVTQIGHSLLGHVSDGFNVSQTHVLSGASAVHDFSSDELTLSEGSALSIQYSSHVLSSTGIELTEFGSLSISFAVHGHLADEFSLVQAYYLSLDDSHHTFIGVEPIIDTESEITVQSSVHALLGQGLILGYSVNLVPDDGHLSSFSEHMLLSQHHVLLTFDGDHSLASGEPAIEKPIISDTTKHGHESDHASLIQDHQISGLTIFHNHHSERPFVRVPPGVWGHFGELIKGWIPQSEESAAWDQKTESENSWEKAQEASNNWLNKEQSNNDWQEK